MKTHLFRGFLLLPWALLAACSSGGGATSSTGGSGDSGGRTASSAGGSGVSGGGATSSAGGSGDSGGSQATTTPVDSGGSTASAGGSGPGGTGGGGGLSSRSASVTSMGGSDRGGTSGLGGTTGATSGGGAGKTGGTAGRSSEGGTTSTGGTSTSLAGGSGGKGGAAGSGGATGGVGGTSGGAGSSGTVSTCSGPVGTIAGELATGIVFMDDRGKRVNAHGGGIIKEGDTYYMHGEYFLDTTTDNNFNGFAMYSSKDLATWKWEKMILPQQPSGLLGPNRKGERPHIIKCPSTGEFVLYAHAASSDYQTDKEVVYATSPTVNGDYTFVGALTNASGTTAAHSDMSAFADGNNAYVLTESGHIYTLAADCHSWVSDKSYSAVNGDSGGSESPTVFKAGSTYYWIGSYKTGWRANNNFYSTAPAMTGPWTFQGFIAPVKDTSTTTPSGSPNPPKWISDERTWLSQVTWVTPVTGCNGTVYVFWGDHWDGTQDTSAPGKHNYLATYVFQPLVFDGIKISMPTYLASWKLDVGAGTWSK